MANVLDGGRRKTKAVFVFGENHFRKCRCLVGLENRIFRKLISVDPKKKALITKMNFRSYFHFKWISERERERESESAKGRQRPSWCRSHIQAPVGAVRKHQRRRLQSEIVNSSSRRSRSVRCFARLRRRSRSCEAARSSRDHDRRRGRRIGAREAPHRRTQSIASVNLGAVFVFLVLSFSL